MQLCYNSLPNCHLSCQQCPGAHMHRHIACTCTYHRDNHPFKIYIYIFHSDSPRTSVVFRSTTCRLPHTSRTHLALDASRCVHPKPEDALPTTPVYAHSNMYTYIIHIYIYIYNFFSSLFMQRKKKMKRRRGHHTSSASWACGFFYNPH